MAREKALQDADDRKKSKEEKIKKVSKTTKTGKHQAKAELNTDIPVDNEFEKGVKKKAYSSKQSEDQSTSTKKKESKKDEQGKTDKKSRKEPQKRRKGKLTISEALNEEERQRSLASLRRRQEKAKKKAVSVDIPKEKISRNVVIPESITVQELSNRMAERGVDVIKSLMQQGVMVKINVFLDADTA